VRLPSPALVIACLALLLAAGGVSYATVKATGSAVNVVDPVTAANAARVDSAGKLEVGDGAGNLTVDGTVVGREAAPVAFFTNHAFPTGGGSCVELATPPSGKALVVKSVSMDTWALTVGPPAYYRFSVGATCGVETLDVNPPTTGLIEQPFEPGVGVPSGQSLWAQANGNMTGEVFAFGYTVVASAVPPAAPTGAPPHQSPGEPPHD